jgi:SAM-dependent methyltransferase
LKNRPEFDSFSDSYDELLKDPIRDRFTRGTSAFFHLRKRDLIREYFLRRAIDTRKLSYLDIGCGKGELLTLLHNDFAQVCGCDPSDRMIATGELKARGIEVRVQHDNGRIPFEDRQFDFVTAVCVYHHVPPASRQVLTAEACRVLKPNGVFAIVEHNPYNPITRLIVNRTPVDADAILLRPAETRLLFQHQGLAIDNQRYFLYLPEHAYRRLGFIENGLGSWLPLGGQYIVFGRSNSTGLENCPADQSPRQAVQK